LDLGRTEASFVNFVNTDGDPLDSGGVSFGPVTIHKLGDANADGLIGGADRSSVKFFMVNGGIQHPWMDCNADGIISGADRSCIKYIMTH
jgi:hypothetical protein